MIVRMSALMDLEGLMEKAPVLAFVKDTQGRYQYVNQEWLNITGYSRQDVLGRTDHELFPTSVAEGFVRNDRQVLETGQTIDVEEFAPAGSPICVGHSTKFALLDAQGRISGLGGIVVNITQWHAAQTALARSEARYRSLMEHSPEAYIVLDPATGRFVDANENACAMFKLTRAELLGVGPAELSPPAQSDGRTTSEAVDGYVADALGGNTPVFDWIHRAGDGELLPCRIWLSRIEMDTGPGVRAGILDLRETERIRSALERTRAQLDAVQDALPQLVVVFDPIRRKVIHSNRTYRKLFGDPPSVGLWDAAGRACQLAVESGTAGQEVELTTVDGLERILDVSVSVFHREETGEATRLLLVGNDVTDQRRLDAELRQSRRLESLGRLAGGVAHDFNNLLTVILASADFLAPVVSDQSTAERDLKALTDAALQAQTLTSQLLAFAKADKGKVEPVEVDRLVTDSIRMLERLLGANVRIEVQLDAHGETVLIDEGQLHQIVVNLSVNSRDAMPKGGTLTIGTRTVEISPGHELAGKLVLGPYLEMSVADTGTGMGAEVAERAFEPFYTTKRQGEGTGLGLSTVFGIVQRAHGHVIIDSRAGRGTVVRLLLPTTKLGAGGQAALAPSTSRNLRARVLLVEDDEAVGAVTARALQNAGHDVTTASSPAQALSLVTSGASFDIVVSDVVMPGMSGFELVEKLRTTLGPVPVLFVSGYAEQALREFGSRSDDISLLEKPFLPSVLVERVGALLGSSLQP